MKTQLLTKQVQVEIVKDITLKDVLSNEMKKVGILPEVNTEQTLVEVSKFLIFNIDGVMLMGKNKLDTVIKQGSVVKLLPVYKAG